MLWRIGNQVLVYDNLIQPLLSSCLEGYNATALTYGQTGAGEKSLLILPVLWLLVGRTVFG